MNEVTQVFHSFEWSCDFDDFLIRVDEVIKDIWIAIEVCFCSDTSTCASISRCSEIKYITTHIEHFLKMTYALKEEQENQVPWMLRRKVQ